MARKRNKKIKTSKIPAFYKLSFRERLKILRDFAGLSRKEIDILSKSRGGESVIENVVGAFPLPLGIATNFLINGRDYLIPMAIEEPSVVAAASNGAKMARPKGGFEAGADESLMIGQIQLTKIPSPQRSRREILKNKKEILGIANKTNPFLLKIGGGAKDIEIREVREGRGRRLVLHLLIDVKDAMGANTVDTMVESVSLFIEKITGGRALLRIVSNLSTERMAFARATFGKNIIGGGEVVKGIVEAYHFAQADPYRAATHNKGIMNGIDAVLVATGNDFRAIEAGAHSFASLSGRYQPLTKWKKDGQGNLVGEIKLPMAVGIVGGAIVNPVSRISLKILGVKTARELAGVIASVGLAQNLAALRALVKEGIQKGHMKLHAKNVAIAAGAKGEMIERVAEIMVKKGEINPAKAKEILNKN